MTTTKLQPGRTNDDHKFKRTVRFEVRLSPIEYDSLAHQWQKSGQHNSMARYARACIFGAEDKIEIALEQKKQTGIDRLKVLGELGRIGSNLNQIAKQLNSKYEFKTPKALADELWQIKSELERISNLNDGD